MEVRESEHLNEEDECVSPVKLPARRTLQPVRLTGNRLDSTVLVHKRGKERTKKKKPTLLKRIILRERTERRRRAGLETSAAALLAGLAVKEQGSAEGRVKQGEGEAVQTAGEGDPAAVQASVVPAQVAETAKFVVASGSVVKQSAAPPEQGEAASQRCASEPTAQSAAAAATQRTLPTLIQKLNVMVKQEPVSPASSQVNSSSPPGSAQKTAVKMKESVLPTSSQSVTPETKGAWGSTAHSIRMPSVKMKLESVSPASPENASLETKPLASSTPDSAHNVTVEVQQEVIPKEDDKPLVLPAITLSDKDSKSADGGDSDGDSPPSRGPDYTPCVTVDPKVLIHSRKFREYCQQTLSPDIDESARLLLQDLTRFQDRLYNRDPIKARSRRRLVFGPA